MKIKIDSAEPPKIANIFNREGIDYEIESLPIGDFICNGVCIERKTISDFISSMRSGHLQKQLIQMQDNYDKCYLIISGSYKDFMKSPSGQYIRGWTVNHHLGAMASVASRYNVQIVQVDNDTQLVKIIPKIIEKSTDGKVPSIIDTELMRVKDKMTFEDIKMLMFHCIPKVGLDRACVLRDNFDIKIINKDGTKVTQDDVEMLDGFGSVISKNVESINDSK